MEKSPKELEVHGCPPEIWCNTGCKKKAGGSGTNHPPPPPTTTTAGKRNGSSAAFFSLLMLVAFVTPYLFLLSTASFPNMSSKLHSFSVTSPSNSSTSICDVVLSAKKNIASCKHLSVDMSRASVLYREERIWDRVMEPFSLTDKEEAMIRVNMSAGALLWQRVAGDFAAEMRRNGTLEFDFYVDAIGKMDGEERNKITIEILCGNLKVGFDSDSEAAQLVGGPKKCKTKVAWG